ncbi:DUF4177 domain-containing protein [Ruegeria atlantica]|uniref:DUF4177 domain-containing protein n=1 Tax=Ruegeria atlantica TaxID=81569 RepID=UPI00147E36C4|nr:DUF4177 domain-containing protein [Ruegeria atlantica]
MKKFEYTTCTYHVYDKEYDERLNKMGKNGWELVSVVDVELSGLHCFFKREVVDD